MEIEQQFTMEELPFEVKCLIVDFLDAVTLCKLSQTSFDWNFIASNSLRWSSLLLSQFGTKRHERTLYLYNCKILDGNNHIMWLDADDELSVSTSSTSTVLHEEPTLISKGRFFKKMYAGLIQFFSWHSYDIPTLQPAEIPYTLESQDMRRVGALGGQRVVFKSIHKPTNQPCIIEKICDRMQERKVLREIKHLRMLRDGPNIPKLLDAFKQVTLPSVQVDPSAASPVPPSTEVSEGPLSRMVFEYRESMFYPQYFMSLNQERIRKITLEVLRTLDYIHSKGFAHRDIKPLSIEVSYDFSNVFLTNWYFLERYDEEVNFVEPLSLSVSSRYYKSPEILFRNDKFLYDPRKLDMWSLGCTLAAMAIRVPIFKGADLNDQLIKIVQVLGTTDFKQFCQRYKIVPPAFMEPTLLDEQYAKRVDLRTLRVPACPYSEDAVDLVEKLLRYDPAERLSASDALKHPFLSGIAAGVVTPQPMHCQPYQ